jgi:hypothetical protein
MFMSNCKRIFSYSATSFNKLGQKRPSLGPCLSLCMENMPLGMSARLVNAQLFSSGRVPVSHFGEEKNVIIWSHDFVARISVQNFFLTSKDQACLYYSLFFF